MGLPFIVYKNLWRDGDLLAATSENAQFPAEYTQDDMKQLFWRSTAIAAEQDLDVDLGSAKEYNFVAILGHNLSVAATIAIKGADDSAFMVNVVTVSLTHSTLNIFSKLAAARTKQYLRIAITDIGNASGYLQVGTIVVGKLSYLNRLYSQGFAEGVINETAIEYSPSMNIFTVEEKPGLFNQVLAWSGLDTNSTDVIKALLLEAGIYKAWVFCPDVDNVATTAYWVHLKGIELPVCQYPGFWTWTSEIEEIL